MKKQNRSWVARMRAALTMATAGSLVLVSLQVAADPYTEAAQAACEHMKECALQRMGDIPPEMRGMVMAGLESACVGIAAANPYGEEMRQQHPLYDDATACMRSMAELSCEAIYDDRTETPECLKLQREAEKYEESQE